MMTNEVLKVQYTNWKGNTREREIKPISLRWGVTRYHTEMQWLLVAWCMEDEIIKEFALKDCDFREDNFPLTLKQQSNYEFNTRMYRED